MIISRRGILKGVSSLMLATIPPEVDAKQNDVDRLFNLVRNGRVEYQTFWFDGPVLVKGIDADLTFYKCKFQWLPESNFDKTSCGLQLMSKVMSKKGKIVDIVIENCEFDFSRCLSGHPLYGFFITRRESSH